MNVHVAIDSMSATNAAADLLAPLLADPAVRSVMLATGNTPLALYEAIALRELPLDQVHVYALDEYLGVPVNEPRNCAGVLRRAVLEPWGIPQRRFHALPTVATQAATAVSRHEEAVREPGGLDIVVLGLGTNGHIGFNEPGSGPQSEGRVVELANSSVEANRQWFNGDYVPDKGVTVGMRLILEAKFVVLLAFGSAKKAAVHAMLQGPQSPECPASYLRSHLNFQVFLDRDAAAAVESGERNPGTSGTAIAPPNA